MKRIIYLKTIIIFFGIIFLFNFGIQQVFAAAQCTSDTSPATVTSISSVQTDFGNLSACHQFCPSGPSSCSATGVCTYTRQTATVFPNCARYCASGYIPSSGAYCVPNGATSCGNPTAIQTGIDVGGGWCVDVYRCSQITVSGDTSNISGSCQGNLCNCNVQPAGLSCQLIMSGGTATGIPYLCAPMGSPPSGLNLRLTVWSDSSRSTVFAGQTNLKTAWAFSQAPFRVSWGAVTDADSCTLNGVPVSVSGGSWDGAPHNLQVPLNTTSITYTLSCSNSNGSTNDTATLYIPPKPVNPMSGSCPAPGTTGTFSWTAPTQNVGGISNWNTFMIRAESGGTFVAYNDNFVGNTVSFSTNPGNSYNWWLHTKHSLGGGNFVFSDTAPSPTGANFVCNSGSNLAMCDGAWREIPGGGVTTAQPVGEYISNTRTTQNALKDSIIVAVRGTDNNLYYRLCNFGGTNDCSWNASWALVPSDSAQTSVSPTISTGGTNFDLLIRSITNNTTNLLKVNNETTGWNNWTNHSENIQLNWGLPYRTNAKGQTWQFRRESSGAIYYSCGANNCVTLPFNAGNSTFSPSNPTIGQTVNIYCDYNVYSDSVSVSSPGLNNCTLQSYNGRTRAHFTCTANTTGVHNVSCVNLTGTSQNACSQTNSLGTINIGGSNQTLNVQKSGTGTGTVTSNPAGINCGTACNSQSASYTYNSSVTLTATPASGSNFAGWSGDCSGATCTLIMNGTRNVTPIFNLPANFTLTVIKSGQGTVLSNPAGINCGNDCSESYSDGTSVTLSANPAPGRIFTGWGGACAGTPRDNDCTVTVSGATTVIVNFAVDPNYKEF